jgi:hypothetical protein
MVSLHVVSVSDKTYTKDRKLRSEGKIEFFYKSVLDLFLLWFLFTTIIGGVLVNGHSLIHWARAVACGPS